MEQLHFYFLDLYSVFGLRNEVIHLFLTSHFFIWFMEYNELIHHHLIPRKLIISTYMRSWLIPPKLME
jgi:hypothetical protein